MSSKLLSGRRRRGWHAWPAADPRTVEAVARRSIRATAHCDPGLFWLRAALTDFGAVLATYGAALGLEHAAQQHVDLVIFAVVLATTLGRTQRGADWTDRLIALVLLAAAAAAASDVGSLLMRHSAIGDVVFTSAVAATIWIRRFGRRFSRAGTVLVIPFVAVLVKPDQNVPPYGADHDGWAALVAVFAVCLVTLFQQMAARAGFSPGDSRRPSTAPQQQATQPEEQQTRPAGRRRIAHSDRMSAQMGTALALAFVAGHLWYPNHWPWVVLTAFIVCSGARGRGDVVFKGVQRAFGAAVGTVVGTWIAGSFPTNDVRSVVIIFAVLGVAIWLREISYVYWAGCVTALLSLLYGYFGESAPSLLRTRLEEIAIGAVIGIAAAWLVLPVRTGDVLRRRVAESLAALNGILAADHENDLATRQVLFEESVYQLELIERPLAAQRVLARVNIFANGHTHRADAIDAVRRLVSPVRDLIAVTRADPDLTAEPNLTQLRSALAANVGAIRLAIGGLPGWPYRHLPPPGRRSGGKYQAAAGQLALARAAGAMRSIDGALADLGAIYPSVPPAEGPESSSVPDTASLWPVTWTR
jgi:Fusaric acid resistance protein-like